LPTAPKRPESAGAGVAAGPDELEALESAALSLWAEGRKDEAVALLEGRITSAKGAGGTAGPASTPAGEAPTVVVVEPRPASLPSVSAAASVAGSQPSGKGFGRRRARALGIAAGMMLVFVPGAVLWAEGSLPGIDVAQDSGNASADRANEAPALKERGDAAIPVAATMPSAVQAPSRSGAERGVGGDVITAVQGLWQSLRSVDVARDWSGIARRPDPTTVLARTRSGLQPLRQAGAAIWAALDANDALRRDLYAVSLGIGVMGEPAAAAGIQPAVASVEESADEGASSAEPAKPADGAAVAPAPKPRPRPTLHAQPAAPRVAKNRVVAQKQAPPRKAEVAAADYADYAGAYAQPYVPPPVYYYYSPRPVPYAPAFWPRARGFVVYRRVDGW
jgi:hypothetical protein